MRWDEAGGWNGEGGHVSTETLSALLLGTQATPLRLSGLARLGLAFGDRLQPHEGWDKTGTGTGRALLLLHRRPGGLARLCLAPPSIFGLFDRYDRGSRECTAESRCRWDETCTR